MQLETVAVFARWDFDHEKKELYGMSAHLLNAVDRVELRRGSGPNLVIDKSLFAREDWFEQLWAMTDYQRQGSPANLQHRIEFAKRLLGTQVEVIPLGSVDPRQDATVDKHLPLPEYQIALVTRRSDRVVGRQA